MMGNIALLLFVIQLCPAWALLASEPETNATSFTKALGGSAETVSIQAVPLPVVENILILPADKPVNVPGFRLLSFGGIADVGAKAKSATEATLRWDKTGLEAVFDCTDAAIVAELQGRDNMKLWKDDCVYVWLAPSHIDNAANTMIMVQVSAGGVVHDNRNKDQEVDIEGLEAEVTRTDTGWRARVKVPWKGLDVPCPKPGDVWCINLTRMDHPGKYDYNTMEHSSWMPIPGGDELDMKSWAHIIVAGATVTPEVIAAKNALDESFRADKTVVAAKLKAKRLAIEPANPNASPDAYKLLKYLASLPDKPDKRVLIGQNCTMADHDKFIDALAKSTGKWPALLEMSWELGGGNTTDIAGNNQMLIDHWNAGGLVSIQLNPVNPFNPNIGRYWDDRPVTRGSLAEVLKPGTPANAIWMDYLSRIARGMAPLRDAGVVVLFRPLHEMTFRDCYWYDAGASYPDPEPFRNLWKLMFNYLTYECGLNNLIWVYAAADSEPYGAPTDFCYPGDEYVDMVGLSFYMDDKMTIQGQGYSRLSALGKPFAFTEFGLGQPCHGLWDNMRLLQVIREKYPETIYALYWPSWTGNLTSIVENKNADKLLNDPMVLNRGELDWKVIAVPDSWVHPPKTDIKVAVVGDNGFLGRIPLKRGTVNLQGEPLGLPYAKDLEVTTEQGVKICRWTVVSSNAAIRMVQRVSENNGNLQIDLEASADGKAPEIWYTLQVPTTRFAGGTYAAGSKTGPLSSDPLPMDAIKFFEGKVRKVSFTAPGGLKLGFELEPAAEIYIQDSRKWSPNFSMPMGVRPDSAVKDGKTKLTIRLSLD